MATLSEVLGTLAASLAQGRYQADVATAAIAEQYRDNPLLEGLSVPRARVPEITIDLPVMITAHSAGAPNKLMPADQLAERLTPAIVEAVAAAGAPLRPDGPERLRSRLADDLARFTVTLAPDAAGPAFWPKEGVVRQAQRTTAAFLAERGDDERLSPEQVEKVLSVVRDRATALAEQEPGSPSALDVSVVTNDIRDQGAPGNVARLTVVLREEGLEWSVTRHADSTASRSLTPE